MFSEIDGLPVHPLAVHAAVVLIPLAALLGLLFAAPRTRAWARLPLLLVALAALASTYVARATGLEFRAVLRSHGQLGGPVGDLVEEHYRRANVLLLLVAVLAVIAVVAFAVTRRSTANSPLVLVVAAVLVIGAVALGIQVYRVGDIGSRAVWNPTGEADYSR